MKLPSEDIAGCDISTRCSRAVQPALMYQLAMWKASQNMWSPTNPDGNICVTIAENCLTVDLVRERLSHPSPPTEAAVRYGNFRGTDRLRAAVAGLFARTFLAGRRLDPDCLTVQAGCGTILDQLFFVLCDAGDAVLIPAPYYPAFDNDLTVRGGVRPVPFSMVVGSGAAALRDSLDKGLAEANGRVRCLLLTNPHNPIGTVYEESDLMTILQWSWEKGLHVVSDEIYALSCFDADPQAGRPLFVSVLQVVATAGEVLAEWAQLHVHQVWGTSKDFCASGLRIGSLYSENPGVSKALDNISYFGGVSGLIQLQVAEMLEDEEWVQAYVAENNRRLRAAYHGLTAALEQHGIPYVRGHAAMFCWINLSQYLEAPKFESERALWQRLLDAGVLLTPGEACHSPQPGYFRCCFAWVPAEALPVMVRRIAGVLGVRPQ
eukprot:EG_transcript_9019